MANAERLGQGLEASPGDPPPALDVRLSSQGGKVVGRAVTADPKVVASGATVALIPDPPAGRVQAYQTTQADEYGNFMLQGLAARKIRPGGVAGFPALRCLQSRRFGGLPGPGRQLEHRRRRTKEASKLTANLAGGARAKL